MQRAFLDHAIEGIASHSADAPVYSLLKLAAEVADCPCVTLFVAHPGRDQIIAGWGVPTSFFKQHLANTPEEIEYRKVYREVHDTRATPEFDNSIAVHSLGIRFIAMVPVPIDRTDVTINIAAADFRENLQRPADMRKRLEDIAFICAGILRQSGEIVEQSKRLEEVRQQVDNLIKGVTASQRVAAFVDGNFRIVGGTMALQQDMGVTFRRDNKLRFSELFPDDAEILEEQFAMMREDPSPFRYVAVNYKPDNSRRIVIIMRICGADINQPKYLLHIRPHRESSSRALDPVSQVLLQDSGNSAYVHENPATLTKFLLSTLIENRKVHHRKGIAYHTIRRWKGSIKDVQLQTLRSLKSDPNQLLISKAAEEIAQEAITLYGADAFEAVASVPCGHSGPDCFACKLAQAVARIMGKSYFEAFDPLKVKGSSHPKTNLRRPKMVLREIERKSTLLIDDVATSGSHIAEATKALRDAGVTVFPLSWIGN